MGGVGGIVVVVLLGVRLAGKVREIYLLAFLVMVFVVMAVLMMLIVVYCGSFLVHHHHY